MSLLSFNSLKNLQISYNFLNLPSVVTQDDIPVAEYSWFADGSKYSVLDNTNNGYYYIGSLIYASSSGNLQIESTNFTDGRINLGENTSTNTLAQDIQYHHKDHLGSVRAITNQSGATVEQNAYYPFGSRHTFGNTYAQTTNRFKFNGKEEQTSGNLQYLDYGARMYDSNIGRWLTQDPLAEKYYSQSPYNYCVNNPVMFVDPEGEEHRVSYNHRNRTITVYATYYTNIESIKSLTQAIKFYNSRTNDKYTYSGQEYSIIYNLSYVKVSNSTLNKEVKDLLTSPYQNIYKIVDNIDNNTDKIGVISGQAIGHKIIEINEKYKDNPTTGAHEIGHTLYLVPTDQHSKTGLMTPYNDASRTAELTQENINNMIESAKLDFWERVKNFVYNFLNGKE